MCEHKTERGQALIIIVLSMMGLVGIVGLVVDGGNAFLDRRRAQNAADSAALAAALARIRGDRDMVTAALSSAAQNGYDNNGATNLVQVYSPPVEGPHAGSVEYIQVMITSHVDTYFARFVGRNQLTNTVDAVARTKTSEVRELLNGIAVISLAPTSNCTNHKSFWIHGDATLNISGGGVFVNSKSDCAFIQQGNGSIRVSDGYSIKAVGGASIQKPPLLTPGISVGAAHIGYPPPFFMPDVGCSEKIAQISEDGGSMSEGTWDGDFPPEGVTFLGSGIYCLQNGINITGDIEGHNVVLKVEEGGIHFSPGADIVLDAPASGDYAGLLIYLPIENNGEVVLDGGPGSIITGTILAPASPIVIKGMSSPNGYHSQIIGYSVEAGGNGNVAIVYIDAENFDSLTMPEVQLSE